MNTLLPNHLFCSPKNQYGVFTDFLRMFHREENRYVNFGRKIGKDFQHLASIKVCELEKFRAKLRPFLKRNGYFSVNDFHSPRSSANRLTGFPDVNRTTNNVHNLNASFIDLDVGRSGSSDPVARMSATDARSRVDACVNSEIPVYSAIMSSGRGLYVFWFLQDANGFPVHADWRTRKLYGEIQRSLCGRLQFVGADFKSLDSSRVLRVPGTRHSITNRRARVLFCNGRRYTLEELADWLQIPHGKIRSPKRKKIGSHKVLPEKSKAGRKGFNALNERRANDILALETIRGGFRRGRRRCAIWYFLQFAQGAGWPTPELFKKACGMAQRCHPPYPIDGCKESVDDLIDRLDRRPTRYRYSDLRLVEDLKIRTDECIDAGLKSIVTPEIKESRKQAQFERREDQKANTSKQLRIAGEQLQKNPTLSSGDLMRIYKRRGLPMSRQTAYRRIQAVLGESLGSRPPLKLRLNEREGL